LDGIRQLPIQLATTTAKHLARERYVIIRTTASPVNRIAAA